MSISVFDLFKVGVGPSSSHTVGPMTAAADFVADLAAAGTLAQTTGVTVQLFGSLSATGRGHGTPDAIIAGLAGARPRTVDPDWMRQLVSQNASDHQLTLACGEDEQAIPFDPDKDMTLHNRSLPFHPNAMTLTARADRTVLAETTYYSVGGGFVITEAQAQSDVKDQDTPDIPYPFSSARELLELCSRHDMRVSELTLANECSLRPESEVRAELQIIWTAMKHCIETGLTAEGTLPGGLSVPRRAARFHAELKRADNRNVIASTLTAMDWINLYALAVNEENAAGGRMVTAPTNGAAGIIPAVLMYYLTFSDDVDQNDVVPFLLAAGAVGSLCKQNASISGAEVGCQGEVGSACAMAAAGLTDVLGGTPAQVENAAEIALEHNLGLTCDPIGGLVQVPCIERNAIAAVKAINAAQMALRRDGSHYVSLDKVIQTMRDTGRDMLDKYKETSTGGLAVNVTEC